MQGAIQDITERKQAEERINERGRFIESLVNLSPNVLYIYDIIEKRNIYTNDGIQRFLGYSIKEIKDMDNQIIANLMHPDDFKIYLNETLPKYAIAKDNEQIIATYRMKHKNGNWKWFTATEIIYSKNNKEEPRQIFGMMIDITELKQIELDLTTAKKEAEESEQRFKIASQSANLGIWDWNVRDNTMIWDERMYDLYGIDKESTVKTIDLWITGLHPEDKDAAIAACNDALEGKSTFDTSFRVKHPDGKVLYLKADGLVIMGSEGQAIRMIGVNRDVTKSKQAEEYRTMNMEILQKLNTKDTLKDSIHNVLTILKTHLNFDAIGIRLQAGEDFPYYTQNGFSEDFLLMENSLLEHNSSGGICRNPDGSACLECTCGLVISGTADLSNPLFTKGGSAWTNDSFQLLDIPLADYPRHNPRNTCMHKGYGSLALVPIKANNKIIGLIQVNDKRKGQLNLELIEFLETIASNIGSSLLRKKAEENLQINEQKQTTMISNISDVIGIIGTDGLIKYKSPTITKYFGWLPSDLVEADAWSTVHPDDLGRCKQAFYSLILENQESTTIEYKYKCKDGSYKPIKLTATNLVNDPTIAGVLLNYHDITDRKLSEKTLQESEEKFRKAFMTSLDAIAINRLEDGMYISINDGFTKILDYSSDEIVGKTSVELNIWNNLNDRKKLTQELLRNGFVENFETRFHTKNGKLKDGLMSASIIQLNGTNHILSNTRDITERKQAENNLKQYSTKLELSNKELAEFVYIASHDLKEPLRGISNCATFIQMDHPKLEEPIKKELYHIISLAERLDIFINELLAFSKIGNTDIPFTECLIKEIVEESIENIRSCGFYTNSEIIIKDFPDTPIICNKERLKHVYQNLITNGLKYNTKKHKRIEIGSFYENNENVYYVYDNGIGIEEKHHEIIFQIFKRLHPKEEFSGGTGVGLAIVKKVILQHHGKIWLKSSPNQGTTFYFTLNVKKD
jgi:PAS domain S-box-containing protein